MNDNTKETSKDKVAEVVSPTPKKQEPVIGLPDKPQHEELVEIQDQNAKADSVSQDMTVFKKFLTNVTGKVSDKVQPIAKRGAEKSKDAITTTTSSVANKVKDKLDFGSVKKVFSVVLVILLFVIVGLVGVNIYVKLQKPPEPPTSVEPTVTPPSYQTYKPSVYAKDPDVIKIEENLDILNREMDTTDLKENNLLPPQLDFNISFK
jgi:hypothetical protein